MRYPSRLSLCFASLFFLPACGDGTPGDGSGGSTAAGSTTSSGGATDGGGGANPSAGGSSVGGSGNAGGGAANGSGGAAAGSGASSSGGGPGGGTGVGGNGAGGSDGPDVDEGGKMNAKPGDRTEVPQDYIRLGEIRILNNNWGSEDLGCSDSSMSVFVSEEPRFGWDFSRGDCADNGNPPSTPPDTSKPDFPQVEFGIHPFGIGDDLVTSPEFSSTTLLPAQLKDISSASVTLDDLRIDLSQESSWNLAMEFWLSEGDPRQPSGSVKVDTEVMAWWGWQNGRWPCNSAADRVEDGPGYTLCHQDDNWAGGQWRYYQFRQGDGSDGNISRNFSGKIDVGAFIRYLVDQKGYSQELWLTRMEVGSEIDDMTAGTVSMKGITFEVNGESRSAVIDMQ